MMLLFYFKPGLNFDPDFIKSNFSKFLFTSQRQVYFISNYIIVKLWKLFIVRFVSVSLTTFFHLFTHFSIAFYCQQKQSTYYWND